jgi:hypothetical protein
VVKYLLALECKYLAISVKDTGLQTVQWNVYCGGLRNCKCFIDWVSLGLLTGYPENFHGFLSDSKQITETVVQIRLRLLLPYPFQSVIH